jgi:hypothetical protein
MAWGAGMLAVSRILLTACLLIGCDAGTSQPPPVHQAIAEPQPVTEAPDSWTSENGRYSLVLAGWAIDSVSPLEATLPSVDGRLRICSSEDVPLPHSISQAEANERTAAMSASAISGATAATVEHREIGGIVVADMSYQQAGFQHRRLGFATGARGQVDVVTFVACGVTLPATPEDITAIDTVLNSLALHVD